MTGAVTVTSALDYETATGYNFTVIATDGAGNTVQKAVTGTVTDVVEDVTAPSTPTLDPIASDDLINKVEHDGVTWLTGSTEANAKITITFDDGICRCVLVTCVPMSLEIGLCHILRSVCRLMELTQSVLQATDAAGNESTAISRAGVIIDSVMPTGLGINAVATDNIIDAAENGAGFTISGTGEAGAIVTIAFSGSGHTLGVGNTVTVSGNGTWSFLVAPKEAGDNFLEGEEIVTVIQTDSVGNTSAAVTKLVQVVSTVIGSGDLRLLGDMSAATKLILNGDVTHTPALTSQLPKSIDANGFDIKATSSIDVSGVVFSNIIILRLLML